MTGPSDAKKPCPHCGSPAANERRTPLHVFMSALLLCAAFYFWTSGHNRPTAAGEPGRDAILTAQASYGRLSARVLSYINSPEADKACGVCVASADRFMKTRQATALREKTKDMVLLPAGEYQIGSPDGAGDPDEHPRHGVYLDAFYIDKYETTIGDYMKFVDVTGGDHPEWARPQGKFNIDTGKEDYYKRLYSVLKNCRTCPVTGVSSKNAQAYCAAKNRRLPTEAEWEAAARGGSQSEFSFGDDGAMAWDYAWYEVNSGLKLHPVGEKKPNGLGIYDMHGNVWEWVSDYYEKWLYQKPQTRNPKGPERGEEHVIRGGSWASDLTSARSANRASNDRPNDDIGFRCAVSERTILSTQGPDAPAADIAHE